MPDTAKRQHVQHCILHLKMAARSQKPAEKKNHCYISSHMQHSHDRGRALYFVMLLTLKAGGTVTEASHSARLKLTETASSLSVTVSYF